MSAPSEPQEPPELPKAEHNAAQEPMYGGYSRFEIENEFVTSLANPRYLQHLATNKSFDDPRFIEYLRYLQYWKYPPYSKYLLYPGPTLRHLELLQQERFRKDIISPDVVNMLESSEIDASLEWAKAE